MKILQTAEKILSTLGITASQSLGKHLLNRKILMGFITLAISIFSQFAFLLCVANTFMDYAEFAYLATTTASIFACFSRTIFDMQRLFDMIVDFERIVAKSKSILSSKSKKSDTQLKLYS